MLSQLRPAVLVTLLFTVLFGLAYPLLITGVAHVAFPSQAAGGLLLAADGHVVGSRLIGQNFSRPEYLHPRPSAAGSDGYDASASSGSNYGPLNADLAKRVRGSADALKTDAKGAPIPDDALTTSGSGLDPDISPAYAALQVRRVAAARGVAADKVAQVVLDATVGRTFGVFGQPRVNVLRANLALDARFGRRQPSKA